MHDDRTHVDLFSGIGGFSLAAESCGLRTVVFVERDPARQRDLGHHWPGVPIIADVNDVDAIERAVVADAQGGNGRLSERAEWGDVSESLGSGEAAHRTVADAGGRAGQWHPGNVSATEKECGGKRQQNGNLPERHTDGVNRPFLLTAGVPCQPASAAGKRQGSGDDRWLWPQTLRVVARLKPRWCVFENPLGLASLALPAALPDVDLERLRGVPGRTVAEIIRGLDLLGYDLPRDRDGVAWIPCVPAVGVGAFHGRDRLWLIARRRDVGHAEGGRVEGLRADGWEGASAPAGAGLSGCPSPEPCGAVEQSQCSELQKRTGQAMHLKRRAWSIPSKGRELPDWTGAELERGADGITRPVKPGLRLLANGLPGRVAKLRGLGNAILPLVASQVIAAIKEQG